MGCGSSNVYEKATNNSTSSITDSKSNYNKIEENAKHLKSMVDHYHKACIDSNTIFDLKDIIKTLKKTYTEVKYLEEEIIQASLHEKSKQNLEDEKLMEFENDGSLFDSLFQNTSEREKELIKQILIKALGDKLNIITLSYDNSFPELFKVSLDILKYDLNFHLQTIFIVMPESLITEEIIMKNIAELVKLNKNIKNFSLVLLCEYDINNRDNDFSRYYKNFTWLFEDLKNCKSLKNFGLMRIGGKVIEFDEQTFNKLDNFVTKVQLTSLGICNFDLKAEFMFRLFKTLSNNLDLLSFLFQQQKYENVNFQDIFKFFSSSRKLESIVLGMNEKSRLDEDTLKLLEENIKINNSNFKGIFLDYFENKI